MTSINITASIIEAFILYILFFFPAYTGTPAFIPFSVYQELFRVFVYKTPAFFLVFYLLNGKNLCNKSDIAPRQGLRFLLAFFAALPVLCLISVCISTAADFFSPSASSPVLEKPGSAIGWLVLSASCLATGLLEETFFRVYLPKRLSDVTVAFGLPLLLSTALFAFSHLYEGPWGVANAFLSGLFLCLVFAKTKNLVGIAMAHGAYNFLVYAMS
ncbi:MAG: CPBP family intramembrane metalloprotease [Treponema sp.]|jgi:membrane protease YdiL (CAAX protease family)|nr:CPBP family intramembrane metalloprotease [Treponema sp.]